MAAAVSGVGKVRRSKAEKIPTRSSVRISRPWTSNIRTRLSSTECRGLVDCSPSVGTRSATLVVSDFCLRSILALSDAGGLPAAAPQAGQPSDRQLGPLELLDDASAVEDQRAVADARNLVQIGGHKQHGGASRELLASHLANV